MFKYSIKTYIKLFLGSVVLLFLLGKSTILTKILQIWQKPSVPVEQKEKEHLASAQTSSNTDDNSFLFVDCTGFFE